MTILHYRFAKRHFWAVTVQAFIMLVVFSGADAVAGAPETDKNDETSRIRITADKLVAQVDAGEIEFVGNVRATRDESVITSDHLKIIYNPATIKNAQPAGKMESIEKIIANGHVRIETDNIIAKSDRAEYSIKSEVLVLQGENSSVNQDGHSITAAKFTLYRSEGKIVVESNGKERVKAILQP
jgi:lipopolysaccharide transport protein LptA